MNVIVTTLLGVPLSPPVHLGLIFDFKEVMLNEEEWFCQLDCFSFTEDDVFFNSFKDKTNTYTSILRLNDYV